MPNHITNVIIPKSGDFEGLLNVMVQEEEPGCHFFDFEQIVPMPKSVSIVKENSAEDLMPIIFGGAGIATTWHDLQRFRKWKSLGPWPGFVNITKEKALERIREIDPELVENAINMIKAYAETGYKSWYDWSIVHWGTKWNSYEYKRRDTGAIQFETAWAAPIPVLEKLAEQFPHVEWTHYAFDEGWNHYWITEVDSGFDSRKIKPNWDEPDEETLEVYRICFERDPEREDA